MKEFMEAIEKNEELKAKVEELGKKPDCTAADFIALAGEYGFTLTEAEPNTRREFIRKESGSGGNEKMKYSVEGGSFPVVLCDMEAGESLLCEGGAMSWMSSNMRMETVSKGGVGKGVGRAFSGETLFLNRYTAENGRGSIAFASSFPGCIRVFEVSAGREVIAQRSAYLASTPDVELSAYVQKRLSTGLFGGEGFVMQRISGNGTVFLEFDGDIREYDLAEGESMIVSTRYLAAMSASCRMDVASVKGMKNKFLGGEGLFNIVITGPGHIWLQTMPISRMARAISRYIPSKSD